MTDRSGTHGSACVAPCPSAHKLRACTRTLSTSKCRVVVCHSSRSCHIQMAPRVWSPVVFMAVDRQGLRRPRIHTNSAQRAFEPRLRPGRSDRGLMCMNPYACLHLHPLQLLGSAGAGQDRGSSPHSCIAKHYRTLLRDIQRTAYTHAHTYNALANKDVTKEFKRTLSWGIQSQFAVASDANAHGRSTLVTSQQHRHSFPCACIPHLCRLTTDNVPPSVVCPVLCCILMVHGK